MVKIGKSKDRLKAKCEKVKKEAKTEKWEMTEMQIPHQLIKTGKHKERESMKI